MDNQQMRVNLAQHGKPIVCESCGNKTFQDVLYLFKISKLITGAPTDTVVPMPSFKCSECGHINEEFRPKEEKKEG